MNVPLPHDGKLAQLFVRQSLSAAGHRFRPDLNGGGIRVLTFLQHCPAQGLTSCAKVRRHSTRTILKKGGTATTF